ncbi:MAG: hypothetical protein HPY83_00950 [Anaerolineae bacterium]|nr:hypothetical protein [Anaerolineae bacterium]
MNRDAGHWRRSFAAAIALLLTTISAVALISGDLLPPVARLWADRLTSNSRPTSFSSDLGAMSPSGDAFGSTTWHFAHGVAVSSGDTHHTWLLLANPGTSPAQASVLLQPDGGAARTVTVQVPALGRTAVYANDHVTGHFSTTITSDLPLVAEQSVFFANDGYTVPGVASPTTIWYLPEGAAGSGYDTYLHVYNPGATTVAAVLRFHSESGQVQDVGWEIGPRSALRLRLAEVCTLAGGVATRVAATAPVVVQRVTYFPGWNGGRGAHASAGTSVLTDVAYFPLAPADANFDSWLMFVNPGDSPVTVAAAYWQGSQRRTATYTLPAHARYTVWLDKEAAEGRAPSGSLSIVLTGSAPFAVEGVTYDAGYQTGTAHPGTPGAAQRWHFAEGSTAAPYTTRLAIFNPGPTGAVANVSLLPSVAGASRIAWALLPGELKVANLNELAAGANSGFTVASDSPVVAQRLMTMTGAGLLGAIGLPEAAPHLTPVAYLPLVISVPGPVPTATSTPTPGPVPEATPTRIRKAEPDSFALAAPITGTANCGTTGLKGRVTDASGAPIAGARVRVWADGWAGGLSNPTDSEGRWDFVLGSGARSGVWFAAVADDAGELLSRAVALPTSDDCSNGHQWLEVEWAERSSAAPTYVLAWSRRLSCAENGGNHHLFIDVTDADGNGLPGVTLRVAWAGGQEDIQTGGKLDVGPGRVEFPMYRGTYTVTVVGSSSDTARQLTVELPDETVCSNHGNTLYHYSYHVVFRAI